MRKYQTQQGVLIVDDSLVHKPHSQETGLVSTYFDHTSNEYGRAINFLTLLYRVEDMLLPVGSHLVVKHLQCQFKDSKEVWKAPQTKNEAFRELLYQTHQNAIPFSYVLADSCGSPPLRCATTSRKAAMRCMPARHSRKPIFCGVVRKSQS